MATVERLAVCFEEGVQVVSTFWGDPAPYTHLVDQAGAMHVHTVGSAEEARRAVDVGVDVVVAQGWEAGGHVWGQVATMPLVPAVVDAVRPIPVLAAGGISDGRGLAAVLALGAAAGWVGTRFLLAAEANTHADYRAAVAAAAETDTVYGVVFDGGWPDAPHRALRNSTVKAWEAAGRPAPGRRPGEHEVLPTTRDGAQLLRYGDDLATADLVGDIEPLALYAGQSSGLIDSVQPAAVIAQTPGRRRPASAQPTRRKAHLTRGSGGVQDTDAEWKCLPLIGHERYFVTWTRAAALEQGRRTTSDLRGSPVPRWRT